MLRHGKESEQYLIVAPESEDHTKKSRIQPLQLFPVQIEGELQEICCLVKVMSAVFAASQRAHPHPRRRPPNHPLLVTAPTLVPKLRWQILQPRECIYQRKPPDEWSVTHRLYEVVGPRFDL